MAISFGSMGRWTTNDGRKYSVAKLDATHYVIAYLDSTTATGKCILASVTGTNITYGTASQFVANSMSYISVTGLDSTHFAVVWSDSGTTTNRTIVGVTNGGTTINSYGSIVDATGGAGSCVSICTLDSTHFAIQYRDANNANGYVCVGSVSGSTITLGTRVISATGIIATNSLLPVSFIDSTHFFGAYHEDATGNSYGFVCSVSGTTITMGTASKYDASAGSTIHSTFSIDTTHIGIAYKDTSNIGKVIIGVISGTTISSWGTATQFNATVSGPSAYTIDSTHAVISYNDSTSSTPKSVVCTISGTTPTFGTEVAFDSQLFETGGGGNLVCSTTVLDSNNFIAAFYRATASTSQSIVGQFASTIAFDAATDGGSNTSYSHTCTGTNRVLMVNTSVITGNTPTVTYNSVSMTQLTSTVTASGYTFYTFYLLNPASGSNTVAISSSGGTLGSIAVSYTGVKQSGFPDSFSSTAGSAGVSPVTGTTTVVASNCWLVGFGWCTTSSGTATISDDATSRKTASPVNSAPQQKYDACDSNGTVSTGSNSINFTVGGGGTTRGNATVISLEPAPAASSVNSNFLAFM